jgi:hypothetical protein
VPSVIDFPFERGRRAAIGELRAFEAELLAKRRADPELSNQLRSPDSSAPAWIRTRNKELVPLKLLAQHICLPDEAEFLLRHEGDRIDAQIFSSVDALDLQITLAGPIWGNRAGAHENSGYQQHQIMVALNTSDCVVGYPPFGFKDGIATGEIAAVSSEDRDTACERGLSSAIANKALHDGRGCTLVIFAQDFYLQLLDVNILSALVDKVLGRYPVTFDLVYVFDSQEGFFAKWPSH